MIIVASRLVKTAHDKLKFVGHPANDQVINGKWKMTNGFFKA